MIRLENDSQIRPGVPTVTKYRPVTEVDENKICCIGGEDDINSTSSQATEVSSTAQLFEGALVVFLEKHIGVVGLRLADDHLLCVKKISNHTSLFDTIHSPSYERRRRR